MDQPNSADGLRRCEEAWRAGRPEPIERYLPPPDAPTFPEALAALACLELRLAWEHRHQPAPAWAPAPWPPLVETYRDRFPPLAAPKPLLRLIQCEYLARHCHADLPSPNEYRDRFPELTLHDEDVRGLLSTAGGEPFPPPAGEEMPGMLGRYRLAGRLGAGSFGAVYRGYDEELHRYVAIKIAHRTRVARPEDVAKYLAEARALAALDHPHIVPIYDTGTTGDGLVFIVTKLIDGSDLAHRIEQQRPSAVESAALTAAVAEALHYAHLRGLVHRDVKPANILVDGTGHPYLTDFGLALKEEDFGTGPGLVGTPYYMSPEQARGEGHRVDGRSDIFSLGVVFYELLTGHHPFPVRTQAELLEQICNVEVRPPRQWDDAISAELERICLEALAKRATDRYTTARDLAENLRQYLTQPTEPERPPQGTASSPEINLHLPVKVIPKGLRAFDSHDAYFFLDLLPGPRDRDGLPQSVRFWKNLAEETDPAKTFTVGVICGPSGSGKSSLVKAALLPHLGRTVLPVYVEAACGLTEARIIAAVRRQCPGLPADLGLPELLAALRHGQGVAAGTKVLLVLDQFEQWLHDRPAGDGAELVRALRQCDGEHLQCLLLVRDDVWMALARLMEELEIRLVQGENITTRDLFDLIHARKVLAAFGRAFGALPESPAVLTREQEAFLDRAVAGLAENGRVVCLRIALFAEMVKGRPWTAATLREVGGTAGVGVAFLEEIFGPDAALGRRQHAQAARAVLSALLPDQASHIKGRARSYGELLEASGYARRPADFTALLHILDAEVRLITPTEPPAGEDGQPTAERHYQLTHDFLVPALRDWLSRKQRETRRGRAEIRLAERTVLWQAKPELQQLPRFWEWANIRWFTRRRDWSEPQRRMMRQAGRYYAACGVLLLVLLLAANEFYVWAMAGWLVEKVMLPDTGSVSARIDQLAGFRRWANPDLRQRMRDFPEDSKERLHASLALLPHDKNQVEFLSGRLLLTADPVEIHVIRDRLLPGREKIREQLWGVVLSELATPAARFRAAAALAEGDADSPRWTGRVAALVVDQLLDAVQAKAGSYDEFRVLLSPIAHHLNPLLSGISRDEGQPQSERLLAFNFLCDFQSDLSVPRLVELALEASEDQFPVVYPKLAAKPHEEEIVAICLRVASAPAEAEASARERQAKRKATAAVVLFRLGHPALVWEFLRHDLDPTLRSYLVHRLASLGAAPGPLISRLEEGQDEISVRRALVLSLGEFDDFHLPTAERERLLPFLRELYHAEDAGLHAAAEWLLQKWHEQDWLASERQKAAKDKGGRGARLARLERELATDKGKSRPRWYTDGQGNTLVAFPEPSEFQMGSPKGEVTPHRPNETRHAQSIPRAFAMASKHVTVEQFLHCLESDRKIKDAFTEQKQALTLISLSQPDHPMEFVTWFDVARYCNWLSQQEGIPENEWCYPKNPDDIKEGMTMPKGYLTRTGYRMPTEAEWEYACRAGALTSRYYGSAEELLGKYAWFVKNGEGQARSVGQRKPNDFGLFDMHGNVWIWCLNRWSDINSDGVDGEEPLVLGPQVYCALRGAAIINFARSVRCAYRSNGYHPTLRDFDIGMRVARTLKTTQ